MTEDLTDKINLSELGEVGDHDLLAASGAASVARRICDLCAMAGFTPESEVEAVKRARQMFAYGAVRLTNWLRAHGVESPGEPG